MKIITSDDYKTGNQFLLNKKTHSWHFKADNVTDFAFGCSDHYLWDAVSLIPDKNSDKRVIVSAAYNPESKDFYELHRMAKDALEFIFQLIFPVYHIHIPHLQFSMAGEEWNIL